MLLRVEASWDCGGGSAQGEEQQEGEESQREERMEYPAAIRCGQKKLNWWMVKKKKTVIGLLS